MEINNLYLDLLKRAVRNYLYLGGKVDLEQFEIGPMYSLETEEWQLSPEAEPHSLLNTQKLNALHLLMYDVIKNDVPGDFIEAGIYRGGTIIFMLGFLKACGVDNRTVWAADSFEGIPQSKRFSDINDPVDDWNNRWETGFDVVKANIARYGFDEQNLRYIKGYFSDSLPEAPLGKLAIARLDADAYESTRDALENIYPKLSLGGYIIIDDWHLDLCKQACLDFRDEHNIDCPITKVFSRTPGHMYAEAFWRIEKNPLADK